MKKVAPHILHQKWVHSYEEDTASEMVFRPEAFRFPRSRGRAGFDLKPDHSLEQIGIAAADGPQIAHGKWELNSEGKLVFYEKSKSEPCRVMQIASADEDCLVIRK